MTPPYPVQWTDAYADSWNLARGPVPHDWLKAWRDLHSRSQTFDVPLDPDSRDSAFLMDVLSATALLTVLAFCTTTLRTLAAARQVVRLPRMRLAALDGGPRFGAR